MDLKTLIFSWKARRRSANGGIAFYVINKKTATHWFVFQWIGMSSWISIFRSRV